MPEDALELVRLRNNFYRDNYRRLVMALLAMLALNAALIGIIIYQYTTRPEPRYFATSADGKITPIYALDVPVVSASALLSWANQAAVAAFSYNFANYRQALQSASEYFTPEGWKDFEAALESSNNLEAVKAKKLVVSAVATGAPVIIDQGVIYGRYSWKVQMPLLVNFQSASTNFQTPLLVTLLITRVSTLYVPTGIAIAQYIAAPAGSNATAGV
jgi:intracellular multiplication protein IcmL